MARPNKASTVAELADHFRESNAAVLTEYRGLTVAQLKSLRRTLGSTVTYAVVKNTLTKIAAKDAGVTGVDDLLAGPSAIAFVKGDAVEAAKAIRAFAKENPALVIKGGYMDGKTLSVAEVQRIADLESREVLLSKLAGAMKAKQSQAAALFAAPLSKTARALGALQAKLEADPSAAAAPAPAEEAAPAVAEETPAEAPAEASTEESAEEVATEAAADDAAAPETTEG
ncbi:MAG TPA: 50S ribosomal protein L10 [Actinobacteria bacterium]|jgi:large subunit ribosomal protein L10|nr:50S ribosomal protein L10 [Actinomycetota bacterium]